MKNYLLLGLILFAGGGVFGDNCADKTDENSCLKAKYKISNERKSVTGRMIQTSRERQCFYDSNNRKCCTQENTTSDSPTTKSCHDTDQGTK